MIGGLNPGWGWEFFSSPLCPHQIRDPPSLLWNGYRGLFLWGKAAGGWSCQLTPSCAEVKNAWSYTSTPQ